jgi:hypothetical protein
MTYVVTVCGAALWVGGLSERVGAAAILGGWIASVTVSSAGGWGAEQGVEIVDILVLAALIGLALRSHRWWPIWAAGFHLLAVVTHWAHQIDPTVGGWAYLTAGIIWGYMLVAALAWGTWSAWRERQFASADPITDPGATRR